MAALLLHAQADAREVLAKSVRDFVRFDNLNIGLASEPTINGPRDHKTVGGYIVLGNPERR
ncbi:MAG: hypothetical protein ACJAR2_000697 [Ilumatobacter sp.]